MVSRLTRVAGHWQQHRGSMIEPRDSRPMSTTSAAELYYLRHTRLCAAAATGNKGGHPGESSTLQISGADFIARLLQSIAETAIKLITPVVAMLHRTLEIAKEVAPTWLTPLEVVACLHLASTDIHQDLRTYHCELDRAGPMQQMSAIAIALLTLLLALVDWHVPRECKWMQMATTYMSHPHRCVYVYSAHG